MGQNLFPDCKGTSVEHTPSHSYDKETKTDFDTIESEELIDKCDDSVAVLFMDFKVTRKMFQFIIYFSGLLCIGKLTRVIRLI